MFWQLIEQNHIEQGFMNLNPDVVISEAGLTKAIYKGAHAADHFCQGSPCNRQNKGFRFSRFSKFGHQQENSRQALFAGVEKLIDEVGLDSHMDKCGPYSGNCPKELLCKLWSRWWDEWRPPCPDQFPCFESNEAGKTTQTGSRDAYLCGSV